MSYELRGLLLKRLISFFWIILPLSARRGVGGEAFWYCEANTIITGMIDCYKEMKYSEL
jgi:hypothetical protein